MSKMLMELTGRRCSIVNENEEYLSGSADVPCEVLEVDEEWIKVAYTDKRGRRVERIERVESLERVEIYEK